VKHRKNDTTKLRTKRLGATEDRVGDRTGPGAGYDLAQVKDVKRVKEVKKPASPRRRA